MGIRLDWEIEADHDTFNGLGEHPLAVQQRRANYRRALLAVILVAGVVLAVAGAVAGRLWYVDHVIEEQLRETVAAEVAALRIGDIAAYLNVQRSGSGAWLLGQTDLFWAYQQLKLDREVELTGNVLALTIEDNRGRVAVEEIIDGERYQVLWFYWRYEDGWRHVPMDVTFWGGDSVYEGQNLTVSYGALDEALVEALVPGLERLWNGGCRWLACVTALPPLTVRVLPDPAVGVTWSPDEPDTLRIASPLAGRRARLDVPLEPELAHEIGTLLAERIIDHAWGGLNPVPQTDADFLYGAVRDWLVGRFLADGGAPGSTFVQSLVAAYGESAPGTLVAALQPASTVAVLSEAFATPLDALPVDWREFFQWRLALEPFLIAQGNQDALLALYDDRAQHEASVLLGDPGAASRPAPTVLRVVVGAGSDGESRAWAVVQYPDGSEGVITFRLVDGVWLRSVPDAAFPG